MIRAIRYSDVAAFEADQTPGSYLFKDPEIDDSEVCVRFWCPCGCGTLLELTLRWIAAFQKVGMSLDWTDMDMGPFACGWDGRLAGGYWEAR